MAGRPRKLENCKEEALPTPIDVRKVLEEQAENLRKDYVRSLEDAGKITDKLAELNNEIEKVKAEERKIAVDRYRRDNVITTLYNKYSMLSVDSACVKYSLVYLKNFIDNLSVAEFELIEKMVNSISLLEGENKCLRNESKTPYVKYVGNSNSPIYKNRGDSDGDNCAYTMEEIAVKFNRS